MKKTKKSNPRKSAVSAHNRGGIFTGCTSYKSELLAKHDAMPGIPFVIMTVTARVAGKVEKAEKAKEEKLKKLTIKEVAAIRAETKMGLKQLLLLPPPPYSSIIPAPGLGKMNAKGLCVYVSSVVPAVGAIPEFAACVPSVDTVKGIYDLLFPLAALSRKDVDSSDRVLLELYDTQLRQNFTNMIINCATLANGNLPLFALTTVATKSKPTKHDGKLPAPGFQVFTNRGRGVLYVRIKKMKYARNFTVYFGKGPVYDAATWKQQVGSSRQLITNLTPGELYGVIVVANGKVVQGFWSDMISKNAPYN